MKRVRKGDIVFHSIKSALVAISRAKSDCYSFDNPGKIFTKWDREGWRVDLEILYPKTPWLVSREQKIEMYEIQPSNGPFNKGGVGKEQYLCDVNEALLHYSLEKLLVAQKTEAARQEIMLFLESLQEIQLSCIEDGCKVDAIIVGENKKATLTINIERLPNQKTWIGKKVGDVLKTTSATLSYRVERIYKE